MSGLKVSGSEEQGRNNSKHPRQKFPPYFFELQLTEAAQRIQENRGREREAEAEGDPARGRFWEEGTPTRDWEWHAHPSFQPMVSPYLEGVCQRIQAGERGGPCRGLQSLLAAQGSSACKVSSQFLELLGIACCG